MQSSTARRTRVALSAATLLLLAPLTACSMQGSADLPAAAPTQQGGAESQSADSAQKSLAADGADTPAGRSTITTGSIAVETKDPRAAAESATTIAESLGGRVEAQSVTGVSIDDADDSKARGGFSGASLTLRVPQDSLNKALDQLGELGTVLDEQITTEDVTTQHVDLQARVKSLETSVARLNDFLSKSTTTSELIDLESALAERQAELDGLKAQLNALEGQVDQSTIWVSFTTKGAPLPGGPANFWEGLLAGLNSLTVAGTGALVLLGILLPWLIVIAVGAVAITLLVRAIKKRRITRGRAVAAPATQPPAASQEPYRDQSLETPPAAPTTDGPQTW
ncbi:MAG: DUF4349 domain-containing protein [Actinobacteria bacterium]|nr:DUF4349 domain-containing protein [Actinomycetota bacterium]